MNVVMHRISLILSAFLFVCRVVADPGSVANFDTEDSLLYWQIDESNEIPFQYAVVYATTVDVSGMTWTKDNGYGVDAIALPKSVEGGFAYETVPGSQFVTLDILTELGTENWSSYTFYIELLQWEGDLETGHEVRMGVSATSTYEDLVSNHHVLGSGLTIPSNLVVWAPQTSTVPEPSSGLLLLLGGACLLLRRRTCHA